MVETFSVLKMMMQMMVTSEMAVADLLECRSPPFDHRSELKLNFPAHCTIEVYHHMMMMMMAMATAIVQHINVVVVGAVVVVVVSNRFHRKVMANRIRMMSIHSMDHMRRRWPLAVPKHYIDLIDSPPIDGHRIVNFVANVAVRCPIHLICVEISFPLRHLPLPVEVDSAPAAAAAAVVVVKIVVPVFQC